MWTRTQVPKDSRRESEPMELESLVVRGLAWVLETKLVLCRNRKHP